MLIQDGLSEIVLMKNDEQDDYEAMCEFLNPHAIHYKPWHATHEEGKIFFVDSAIAQMFREKFNIVSMKEAKELDKSGSMDQSAYADSLMPITYDQLSHILKHRFMNMRNTVTVKVGDEFYPVYALAESAEFEEAEDVLDHGNTVLVTEPQDLGE